MSSTRSSRPATTQACPSWTVTTAVRVSPPWRAKEYGPSRSHGCSVSVTRAQEIAGCVSTKCRPSSSPNSSIEATPCFFANAYTVFFWVSVGSTSALSPVRCVAARSPASATLTVRSRSSWRCPSRTTRTRRVSALP